MTSPLARWFGWVATSSCLALGACGNLAEGEESDTPAEDAGGGGSSTDDVQVDDGALGDVDIGEPPPANEFPLFLEGSSTLGEPSGVIFGHYVGDGHCAKPSVSMPSDDPVIVDLRFELEQPGEAERLGASGIVYTSVNSPQLGYLGLVDLSLERASGSTLCHVTYVGDMDFPFDGDDAACEVEAGTDTNDPVTALVFTMKSNALAQGFCILDLRFVSESFLTRTE